ncbi:MAG: DUF2905 domain-containing protein [Aquificaceae bacterium]|nr:DUF2905 domain-containing protein [Aquificaceae bacterium]MCX8075507.1 DUF2905 domain-containing protein [Aquificaceae bacterium]MDW8434081.1 DUF2905 domain-containing protein [Aquificaceae bacterium]
MSEVGKFLVLLGVVLFTLGLMMVFYEKLPFGLGRLPGDILIKRDGYSFYFPLATSLILSVVLSLLFTLFALLLRR